MLSENWKTKHCSNKWVIPRFTERPIRIPIKTNYGMVSNNRETSPFRIWGRPHTEMSSKSFKLLPLFYLQNLYFASFARVEEAVSAQSLGRALLWCGCNQSESMRILASSLCFSRFQWRNLRRGSSPSSRDRPGNTATPCAGYQKLSAGTSLALCPTRGLDPCSRLDDLVSSMVCQDGAWRTRHIFLRGTGTRALRSPRTTMFVEDKLWSEIWIWEWETRNITSFCHFPHWYI